MTISGVFRMMRLLRTTACLFATVWTVGVSAAVAPKQVLAPGQASAGAADDPAVTQTRLVKAAEVQHLAVAVAQPEDRLIFPFFPDATYTVTVTRVTAGYGGATVIEGTAAGVSDTTYLSVSAPDGTRYELRDANRRRLYQILSRTDGTSLVLEYDETKRPPTHDLPPVVRPPKSAPPVQETGGAAVTPLSETEIDLMLVFDTGAQTWATANGGITTLANAAVSKMNTALVNSGIACTFRLAYVWLSGHTYSGSLYDDLFALEGATGNLASVSSLRNSYGADIVSMLVDTGSSSGTVGIGYLPGSSAGDATAAFSVCAIRSVNVSHTMSHEIGHNLGCGHSKNQHPDLTPGPSSLFTYAAGWYFTGNNSIKYHTIMAYNFDGYGATYTACDYFSTPTKTHQGVAVGHATNGDNARTITTMKTVIAAYRAVAGTVVAMPQFSPASGTAFGTSLSVTLTCDTSGATIRYTTNGSEPTASSTLYTGAITVSATTTLKAKGFKSGLSDSATATAQYTKTAANDAFVAAIAISGSSGTVSGNNSAATKEGGEPSHSSSGGASVWWKWTAPATGSVTFDTAGSSFDTLMAAYRGTAVNALTKLAENDDSGENLTSQITFVATNGILYYVAVDGYLAETGNITLNWLQNVPIPSAPTGLTAGNGASTATVALSWSAASGATAYEVWRHTANVSASASKIADPASASHSDTTATPGVLYYYWVKAKNAAGTSPFSVSASGYRALSVPGSVSATDGDAAKVRVTWSAVAGASHYRVSRAASVGGTKSDLGSWQSATFYDDTSAPTGETCYYWVRAAVDSSGTRASAYSVLDSGVRPSAGPPNDAFAAAIALAGAAGQASGDNRGGTMQAGEPSHNSDAAATASVWWSWTAPVAGQAVFDTAGSSFDTVLAVYTGTSLGALTAVASNDDAFGTASRAAFNAVGGVVYRVAVAGYGGATGDVVLNWVLFAPDGPTIVGSEFITLSGQSYLRVRFKGKAGKTYAAQRATALAVSPQWQALTPPATKAATADGIQTLDVPLSGGMTSGFFKIVQQ